MAAAKDLARLCRALGQHGIGLAGWLVDKKLIMSSGETPLAKIVGQMLFVKNSDVFI